MKQTLSLDGHELFTQLCAHSHLVKLGPRHGLFTCFVQIEEGVIRVWRKWLKDIAEKKSSTTATVQENFVEEIGKGKEVVREIQDEKRSVHDENILWVDPAKKNTGLRFSVKEKKLRRNVPILIRADEDTPVSYEIEYDGKDLTLWNSYLS